MSRHSPAPRAVENYTLPFLWVCGGIVFMGLWTIASVAGFLWVVIAAILLDRVIAGVGHLRHRPR